MKTRKLHLVDEEDINVYSKEGNELLLEDDEISTVEAAFMRGYLDS